MDRSLISTAVFVVVMALSAAPLNAVIITGETAVASGGIGAPEHPATNRLAINVVNDSGITINSLDLATDGQITHDATFQNMWTNEPGNGPNAAVGLTLTIDLGGGSDIGYDLTGMRIWNYNGSGGGTDQAIDNYDLQTSRDGSLWTLRQDDQSLAVPAGTSPYNGVYTAVNWSDVRFVRLITNTTARLQEDIGGLSEMMFEGTVHVASAPVPEPATGALALLAAGWYGLSRRRRDP